MTDVVTSLKSVQFVVDAKVKRTGALLSIAVWEALLDGIENQQDAAIIQQAIAKLKAAGERREKAGWLVWEAVQDDWDKD
jgi:hypothetical protein